MPPSMSPGCAAIVFMPATDAQSLPPPIAARPSDVAVSPHVAATLSTPRSADFSSPIAHATFFAATPVRRSFADGCRFCCRCPCPPARYRDTQRHARKQHAAPRATRTRYDMTLCRAAIRMHIQAQAHKRAPCRCSRTKTPCCTDASRRGRQLPAILRRAAAMPAVRHMRVRCRVVVDFYATLLPRAIIHADSDAACCLCQAFAYLPLMKSFMMLHRRARAIRYACASGARFRWRTFA